MEFIKVKELLKSSKKEILSLYPTIYAEEIINNLLEDIDNAIINNIDLIPAADIDHVYKRNINTLLEFSVEAAMSQKLNNLEKEVLSAISILLENCSNLFENLFDKPYLLKVFALLLEANRSLEDNIILNAFMYNKLKSISNAGVTSTVLSDKYLTEYRNFLKSKSHDDNYSLNNTK